MASGDLVIFDEMLLALGKGIHVLDGDVLKLAILDDTVVPTANDTTPVLGDYTAVSGGNFPATPDTMAVTLVEAAGVVTFDITTNVSYAKNAANPSNVFFALLYNSSKADQAIGFVEIAAAGFDGKNGLFTLTWGANVFTITKT